MGRGIRTFLPSFIPVVPHNHCPVLFVTDPMRMTASGRIEYDSTFGYPRSLFIDPNAQIADEEYGYVTTLH